MHKRLNAKEVSTPMSGDKFIFPDGRWNSQTFWRRSGSENIHLNRGSPSPRSRTSTSSRENQTDLLQHHFETLIVVWWWSWKWFLVQFRRFYVPSSRGTQSQIESTERKSFPVPLKYIDVTRTTDTTLDVLLEKHMDDYWNVDGDRELSDAWRGSTRFSVFGPGWVETDKKTSDLQARHFVARDVETHVRSTETKRQKWAIEKPNLENARRLRSIYFTDLEDEELS